MDARCIIEGEGGIGKSWFALALAELLDPAFVNDPERAVENQIPFSAKDYLLAVKTLPPFSVIIYDEPGQSFHHREFMSEANIILSKTMITYRFKRFISFMNIPGLGLVDKDGKMLVKFLVNVVGNGHAEVFQNLFQKFGGEPWWDKIVDNQYVHSPGVKLRHFYEKKKAKYEDGQYEEYWNTLSEAEVPVLTNADIRKQVLAKLPDFMNDGAISVSKIMGAFDIGRDRARGIKAKVESEKPE